MNNFKYTVMKYAMCWKNMKLISANIVQIIQRRDKIMKNLR